MSNNKKFVTKNHVSKIKQQEIETSLRTKLSILTKYLNSQLPENFIAHQSDKKLVDWHDPTIGVSKVSLNAAKGQAELWKQLVDVRKALKAQPKEQSHILELETNNTPPRESQAKLRERNKELNQRVKSLTDELVALRVAYLELINRLEESEVKDIALRESIKRHKQHHGLQLITNKV